MRWFLKSVRAQIALPVMVLLGVLSAFVLDSAIAIPIIDVGRAFGELPYTAVLPLVAVIVIGTLESSASSPVAASSSRAHPILLTGFALAAVALYSLLHYATLVANGNGSDLAAARNVVGYSALLFIGQAAMGLKRAPLIPVLYVVIATIFGRVHGEVQPWAWPALPATGIDLLIAIFAAILAALLVCMAARRFTERFYDLRDV